jgi:tryptophan synthase alpha chain
MTVSAKSGRIETCFKRLKQKKRAALITFISAGDPDYDNSLKILLELPKAGADIVELGMPFTDPMADGPSVQAAGLRALKAGHKMAKTLAMAKAFREVDNTTPIVLMGYFNPIHSYGPEKFMTDAAAAGIDGMIIVDLPPEENKEVCAFAEAANLRVIHLATPTTDEKRLPKILKRATGFLYYVSITGVTGAAAPDLAKVEKHVSWLRGLAEIPVVVGFGIRRPDQAAAMGRIADGVVVGSAIVDLVGQGIDKAGKFAPSQVAKVSGLVRDLARGIASSEEILLD